MYGPAVTARRRSRAQLERADPKDIPKVWRQRLVPGHNVLYPGTRTAYHVEEDGSLRKLDPAVAVTLIEEREAKDRIQEERERIIREKNEREEKERERAESHALEWRNASRRDESCDVLPLKDGDATSPSNGEAGSASEGGGSPPPVLPSQTSAGALEGRPAGPPSQSSLEEDRMLIRSRDVTLSVPPREEGGPAIVRLTYRPTGETFEGRGEDYEAARRVAWDALLHVTARPARPEE